MENFYKALTWWMENEATISKSFKDYTSQLYEEHVDFFTESMVSMPMGIDSPANICLLDLELGQETAVDLETTPEIERTSYGQSSRQSTLSEDVLMQDNESTTVQENQESLPNISLTRSKHTRPSALGNHSSLEVILTFE